MTARRAAGGPALAPDAAAAAAAAAEPPPRAAPVRDVAEPSVAVAVPHADSVAFVAGEMRGAGAGDAADGGPYFVCVVEARPPGRQGARAAGRPRFVAVDNLEVLRAARESGAARVGIRVVGGGRGRGRGGSGRSGADAAALREHLARSSLRGTIDPFAAAEAVERLGGGGRGGGGGDAGRPYLGPYLERAVSLGFGGRPRSALSDMVRRVYACGVRQAPPLPFLISVSRLGEDEQVAVADMTARLCEAVRQRHFAWSGADVIRLLLQGAGMGPGPDGDRPAAGAARLPPTLRPPASSSGAGAGGGGTPAAEAAGGGGEGGGEGPAPAASSSAPSESRAARLSMFYCTGCKKRYCVLKGGVREVAEDRDGCYVVSPGPEGGAAARSGPAPSAEVIHALPSAQREYLGLDDDSSLMVVRAAGADALRKKADDLRRRGAPGPFVVMYASDRGRRPSGRGRKRRIAA